MYQLFISDKPNKKYVVKYNDGNKDKYIYFGDTRYQDYTTHHDLYRKEKYINRHKKEDWIDLHKAGTWARYILWNKPTIKQSILDMEKLFNIKILLNKSIKKT